MENQLCRLKAFRNLHRTHVIIYIRIKNSHVTERPLIIVIT